jgi:hypothetical protein
MGPRSDSGNVNTDKLRPLSAGCGLRNLWRGPKSVYKCLGPAQMVLRGVTRLRVLLLEFHPRGMEARMSGFPRALPTTRGLGFFLKRVRLVNEVTAGGGSARQPSPDKRQLKSSG